MKLIINYFKRRKEEKLRKWCIETALKHHSYPSLRTSEAEADLIYQYIKQSSFQ